MKRFLNRELSWIDFNKRVLGEAEKDELPLKERLKFLAIVNSNFDEFMMVRMANLIHEIQWDDHGHCPSGEKPSFIFKQAILAIREVQDLQNRCFKEKLNRLMGEQGLPIVLDVNKIHPSKEMNEFFIQQVEPLLTPIGWVKDSLNTDLIKSGQIHLYLRMKGEKEILLPVPDNLPRFFELEEGGWLPLEYLINLFASTLFPKNEITSYGLFRILRDADLSVDERRDENFMVAMEEVLEDRINSQPIFLEHSHLDKTDLHRLIQLLGIPNERSMEQIALLRMKDFFQLLSHNELITQGYPLAPPIPSSWFQEGEDPWQGILSQDHLLHHPYQSYYPVVHLLQKAAKDPKVLAIKMTLYRTSGDSPIVNSLLEAAKRGKQVMVLVELKARFDEQRNIKWAKKLSRAGVMVVYGVAGLKVHAKAMLILRNEKIGIQRYLHLGTGNYNDKTAEVYTDFSYFTARKDLTMEASRFFNALSGYSDPPEMKQLAMAPYSLRSRFESLIQREISRAESGEEAMIIAKMNSLNDEKIIELLYKASQAGVKIDLNIRGICSLIPQQPGLSENIRVISLIGRYLEHCRCYYFHNSGARELYLSSADWMPRNLDKRVELLFPILDKKLKDSVLHTLELCLSDNSQTHTLNAQGKWIPTRPSVEKSKVNCQSGLFQYYSSLWEQNKKKAQDTFKIRKKPKKE